MEAKVKKNKKEKVESEAKMKVETEGVKFKLNSPPFFDKIQIKLILSFKFHLINGKL